MAEATPPAPASLLEVATDAAAEAASMVLARAGASFALETKASDIDRVTENELQLDCGLRACMHFGSEHVFSP